MTTNEVERYLDLLIQNVDWRLLDAATDPEFAFVEREEYDTWIETGRLDHLVTEAPWCRGLLAAAHQDACLCLGIAPHAIYGRDMRTIGWRKMGVR